MNAAQLNVNIALPHSSMNKHLLYPEKNRVETEQKHQGKDNIAPIANPKRVPRNKGKKNVRRNLMSPHIKENMRNPSNDAAEINRPERIHDFLRIKPEKPINSKNGSFKPSLHSVDKQADRNGINC